MPLCYGGGITNAEQARRIVGLLEKIAVSAAGRPTIAAHAYRHRSWQPKRGAPCSMRAGRAATGSLYAQWLEEAAKTVVAAARIAQDAGAGEILVNSIDQDGRMKGYDLELAKQCERPCASP